MAPTTDSNSYSSVFFGWGGPRGIIYYDPTNFVQYFCDAMRCDQNLWDSVWRIRRLQYDDASYTNLQSWVFAGTDGSQSFAFAAPDLATVQWYNYNNS